MTRYFLVPALALTLTACTGEEPSTQQDESLGTVSTSPGDPLASTPSGIATVGTPPNLDSPILPASVIALRAEELDGQEVRVRGTVSEVCQAEGCWLTLDTGGERVLRLEAPKTTGGKDAFTFPTDATGATAEVVGTLALRDGAAGPPGAVVVTVTGARLTRPGAELTAATPGA